MKAEIVKVPYDDPRLRGLPGTIDVVETVHFWIGLWNGKVVMVWGLVPGSFLSEEAYVWSVAKPLSHDCFRPLIREGRRWLQEALKEFPRIRCCCNQNSTLVRHLGGKFMMKHNGIESYLFEA